MIFEGVKKWGSLVGFDSLVSVSLLRFWGFRFRCFGSLVSESEVRFCGFRFGCLDSLDLQGYICRGLCGISLGRSQILLGR
jgi:hypothetical protein